MNMNDTFFHPPTALKLDSPNLETEWRFWQQKFELFIQATGAGEKPESAQLAMFLAAIGDDALKVYNTFEFSNEADRRKLSVVVNKFKAYCTPQKNVVFERFQFWRKAQIPGENIDTFVTSLRLHAKSCDFGNQEESLIRDRIVFSCSDSRLQERLLREGDLTLQKALNICRAAEATKEQVKLLQSSVAAGQSLNADVQQVNSINRQQPSFSCCGSYHPPTPNSCHAYGQTCHACGGANHFARMCRSVRSKDNREGQHSRYKQYRRDQSNKRQQNDSRSVNEVTEASEEIDEAFVGAIYVNIDLVREDKASWHKSLSINGSELNCKLDTGAEANVMSRTTFRSLEIPAELRAATTILTAYDNNGINPLGVTTLQVVHKNVAHQIEFFVVDYKATTILGLPSCIKLDVVRRVDALTRQFHRQDEGVLAEYSDVFVGLGCFPGEHHIVTDKNVQPVIHAPRRVPLSLQPKLKQSLEAMVKSGTIVKRDEPTDWVSSLLLVEKPNGKLRLCLDPTDLNRAIKREHYVIPTSEDVIAKLHGKRIFTVIDMKDAFGKLN